LLDGSSSRGLSSGEAATGHDFLNIQRLPAMRGAEQAQGTLRTLGDADPAAHAGDGIHLPLLVPWLNGPELALPGAQPAIKAECSVHDANVPGRGQHGRPAPVGPQGPATTGAAVADGVKPAEHHVLEKGMVDVAPVMFRLENLLGFILGDPTAFIRMVRGDEPGKGLSHYQADAHRDAGIGAGGPTRAVQGQDMVWMPQYDFPGRGIRNDLFQVPEVDVSIHRHQFSGMVQVQHLAVIGIGKSPAPRTR